MSAGSCSSHPRPSQHFPVVFLSLATWMLLAAWSLSKSKKQPQEFQFDLQTLISALNTPDTTQENSPSSERRPFALVSPRFLHGFLVFSSIEFPQLVRCYLEMVTGENNAASCFGCTVADAPPLCLSSPFFYHCIMKTRFIGKQFRRRRHDFSTACTL